MKMKTTLLSVIRLLLIMLWVYTAIAKWKDPALFHAQLNKQPLPEAFHSLVFYLLPSIELLAAGLLSFGKTLKPGLYLSATLMLFFTVYVALALSGLIWDKVPCSCGGVISSMSWKTHLWFNIIFTSLALIGLKLSRNKSHRHSKGKMMTGDHAYPSGIQ